MNKETIIVGAGHYGLIAAHFLKKENRDFLVLEQNDRVGDGWRKRFDSMTLFTPSSMAALPELPMELEPEVRPNKTQMGDYLDRYVDHFALPVNTNHKVEKISLQDGLFHLQTSMGKFTCENLFMAHGNLQKPLQPSWLDRAAA
jgi:putative flavoprotein involved in K+ transport